MTVTGLLDVIVAGGKTRISTAWWLELRVTIGCWWRHRGHGQIWRLWALTELKLNWRHLTELRQGGQPHMCHCIRLRWSADCVNNLQQYKFHPIYTNDSAVHIDKMQECHLNFFLHFFSQCVVLPQKLKYTRQTMNILHQLYTISVQIMFMRFTH